MLRGSSSLTLAELIVVIFIIGLLAGAFIPMVYITTNSKFAEYTKIRMEKLKLALLEFYRDLDQFPMDSGDVSIDFLDLERRPPATRFYGSTDLQNWRRAHWDGPYIQDKFNDNSYMRDAWNNLFVYDYTYGNSYCTITSYGPNRVAGGGDDITMTVDATDIIREKIRNVQDELDIIKRALNDFIKATGNIPNSITDLFEWEVLNMHMDEDSWASAVPDEVEDSSGLGNHGTAYLGANTTDGLVGRAGDFRGIEERVIVQDDPSLDIRDQITIECWVNLNVNHSSSLNTMIRKNGAYALEWGDAGTNRPAFILWWAGGGYTRLNGPAIPRDEWHYLVARYDGSWMQIYIDGELTARARASGQIRQSTANLNIGAWVVEWYNGLIDELRIYRFALSPEEIHRRYENPGYPRNYYDLHDYGLMYDEWESEYDLGFSIVDGKAVYYFYSYGPDREDDDGLDDDILPRGLE